MKTQDELLKELKLLEDLEAAEAIQPLTVFKNIETDSDFYNPPDNEYLKKYFSDRPVSSQEILKVYERENFGQVLFFRRVDGSSRIAEATTLK